MSFFYISPVSSSQGVFQAIRDDSGFNGQLQIEVLPSVDELLSINSDLLQQILKHAELRGKTGQKKSLFINLSSNVGK